MTYTVSMLAKLSGVSIRTLRYYDEIDLLKPAYVGDQGYRYYQNEQLLILQQILFFRELGFELKQIQEILQQVEPDRIKTLQSQKKLLRSRVLRLQTLMKTIDKTINHLKGKQMINEKEIFKGFDISSEQQKKYEKELEKYFSGKMKKHDIKENIKQSNLNVTQWSKQEWQKSGAEFDEICKELVLAIDNNLKPNSPEVQKIIRKHYKWLMKFWKPTKESYADHAELITEGELGKTYRNYHPALAQFISDAIKIFAGKELK